jgi:hypothetical protein
MGGWLAAEAEGERGLRGDTEDEDLKKAFEEWKSKPYGLTVPLRIVGLRGSVPPAWLKVYSFFLVFFFFCCWVQNILAGQCSLFSLCELIFVHVVQEFLMSQGKNAKVSADFKGSLSDILADLAQSMENNQIAPRSTMAADLVTVGDSWLATAVQGGLIEPIRNAEQFDWFKRLHPKWQVWQILVL